jgi:hypothetical protein
MVKKQKNNYQIIKKEHKQGFVFIVFDGVLFEVPVSKARTNEFYILQCTYIVYILI